MLLNISIIVIHSDEIKNSIQLNAENDYGEA